VRQIPAFHQTPCSEAQNACAYHSGLVIYGYMHKAGYQQHGFTIVELLVVIVVIGILAAITVVAYTGISQKAIVASLQSDLTNSVPRLKMYQVEHGAYPATLDGSNCPTGPADTNYCLKPSSGNTFAYSSSSPYSTFSLVATNTNGTAYNVTDSTAVAAGSLTINYTLTISAGANGTVNTAVNGSYSSGSTPTITATPSGSYVFSSWSGSTGCSGTTTASYAITMDGNKTCTANFVVDPWPNWYYGIAATALAGKHVYKTDLGSTMQYRTTIDYVVSPQGATGLDPNYPSWMSLVSPQTNPGVDFSAYPAQNACKAIGGRLPNVQELLAIYAGKATYGNNFQADWYWSSTESYSTVALIVPFTGGSPNQDTKTGLHFVRCVSG